MSIYLFLKNRTEKGTMGKYKREFIPIENLLINPENKRYIDPVDDEIQAITAMFYVIDGKPPEEMVTLALDISINGLNPFEQPIVVYDEDYKKYIVIEGNRRIICIKMMTIYCGNPDIAKSIPKYAASIFNYKYEHGNEIECVIYDDIDEANDVLSKIHQDVNGGVGRKQWGAQEKDKDKAEKGEKSKTYAIVEFVKQYPKADAELLGKMKSKKWVSKLQRVVGFTVFRTTYNITFDVDNNIIYSDDYDHVYKMMAKLITDLIKNPATGHSRLKEDFEKYCSDLPNEFKTQIENKSSETDVEEKEDENENSEYTDEDENSSGNTDSEPDDKVDSNTLYAPKPKRRNKQYDSVALGLTKKYLPAELSCLREKGIDIMSELNGLDVSKYPYASSALCRAIIEYTLHLWCEYFNDTMISNDLKGSYNKVIQLLQSNNIIDGKRHSSLHRVANKDQFISDLNNWIHSDPLQCVRPETLKNGWLACRILIELYIDKSNQK